MDFIALVENEVISLDDYDSKYVSDFNENCTVLELLKIYSQPHDYKLHKYNHCTLSQIFENVTMELQKMC
ncbi:MAG TPA: hypothetical protein DD391_04815 [Clostridiales bacterium]|nr:hypothetical protein [Clostridiales bacterium]HBL81909.1 hypothetical protein [Clostridiales bacterium]